MSYYFVTFQTSGCVQFVNDMPPQFGELHAAFVLSSVGSANIASVDPSPALVGVVHSSSVFRAL